jgi:hypothetical protein
MTERAWRKPKSQPANSLYGRRPKTSPGSVSSSEANRRLRWRRQKRPNCYEPHLFNRCTFSKQVGFALAAKQFIVHAKHRNSSSIPSLGNGVRFGEYLVY